jgi:hypothetical protein
VTTSPKYQEANVQAFIEVVKGDPMSYAKGIDRLVGNHIRPELKCAAPCYQCLESDPAFCTACWGPGNNMDFVMTFLQT